MNSINLIGRLTAEPELRRTTDGTAVCSYSLAVKRPKVKDTTDFISCVTWRQGAEYLSQYGHKGDVVAVSGVLTGRKWQDKDGNSHISWEVVTDNVALLSSKKDTQGNTQPAQNQNGYNPGSYERQVNAPKYNQQSFQPIDFDDASLPF